MGYPAFSSVALAAADMKVEVNGNNGPDKLVKVEAVLISATSDQKRLTNVIKGPKNAAGKQLLLASPWTVVLEQSKLPAGEDKFSKGEKVIVAGIATTDTGKRVVWGGFTAPNGTVVGSTKVR